MPLLEVKNLTVFYGAIRALQDISLEVHEGEIVAMIGPNGAGKSTALKAISGLIKLEKPSSGDVIFQGNNIENLRTDELVKKGLSLVPEGRKVFTSMTVQENLEMGGYTFNGKEKVKEALYNVYDLFPKLAERRKQRAGTLSSGEQQMLAMGRALMLKPKLLLLDEPSLGLSPNFVDLVFDKIKEINANGTAILLVEQNARIALEYSHRGYVFDISEIAFTDKSKNLLKNTEIRKLFLGE
jgi:branched-chain amino acid transport system ATP-binding protein